MQPHSKDLQAPTEGWVQPAPRLVLTVGLNRPLESTALAATGIVQAQNAQDTLHFLAEKNVAVLVLGPLLTTADALDILAFCTSELPLDPPSTLVLCAGNELELFQQFIDEGRVFYLTRRELDPDQLGLLVACAANHFGQKANGTPDLLGGTAPFSDRLLDLCVRLPMQQDLSSLGGLLIQTMHDMIHVSYVQCLVYDPDEETLTSTNIADGEESSYSAASGLAAFVARTGNPVRLDRVGDDPRYDSDIDNPTALDHARLAAEPIFGPAGTPVGVLLAVRNGESPSFSTVDLQFIRLIAECAAPTLSQILLKDGVQDLLTGRVAGEDPNSGIFRQEALEHHIRSWDRQGDVLKTLPLWLRRTYWAVLALVLVGLLGLVILIPGLRTIFGKVN